MPEFLAPRFAKWQVSDDFAFGPPACTSTLKFEKSVLREQFKDWPSRMPGACGRICGRTRIAAAIERSCGKSGKQKGRFRHVRNRPKSQGRKRRHRRLRQDATAWRAIRLARSAA